MQPPHEYSSRLWEEDLNAGRFKNLQFPHPDHSDESHTSDVYFLQFSGKYLVSCSRDRSIRVWDLSTQRLVLPPLLGHEKSVLCAQFDERPENDILISGGVDAHVLVWRFSTGKLVRKIDNAHAESVLSLGFNESYLLTGSLDGSIKVWDRQVLGTTPTDEGPSGPIPKLTLKGHDFAVNCVVLSDDRILSGAADRRIKIWDLATGECQRTIIGHARGIACLQLTSYSQMIISGSSDASIRIFNSSTGMEIACLKGHSNIVRTVQARLAGDADPESRTDLIVSGSYDGSIAIWRRGPPPEREWAVTCRLGLQDALQNTPARVPYEPADESEIKGRIFKLQFDARRLICCGQGPKIVGWAFESAHEEGLGASKPSMAQ